MKTYITNGYEYFYDKSQKQWVLYPVDNLGNRIEWDYDWDCGCDNCQTEHLYDMCINYI